MSTLPQLNMNWIKTNTFLAGLIGVVVLGAAVFGYLIVSGKGRADAARVKIEKVTRSYQSSSRLDEVPVEAVLELKEETVKNLELETEKLRSAMIAKYGAKGEGRDASTFGQRVEARYTELRALWEAEGSKMKVPDNFFLGFEKYRTSIQAQPTAVAELDRQLAGLSWVVEMAVDGGIDEILKFDRQLVEGEEGATTKPDNNDNNDVVSPLNRYSLEASFRGNESEIRTLLNTIVSSDSHLFGVRYVRLRNSKTVAPARSAVESQVEAPKPVRSTDGGFDFTAFTDDGEDAVVDDNPFAGMSDSERRAAEAAAGILGQGEEEEAVVEEGATDTVTSQAGTKADFTQQPGSQDAVVFLGEEDVILTVVLDYVIFAPVATEDEAAE